MFSIPWLHCNVGAEWKRQVESLQAEVLQLKALQAATAAQSQTAMTQPTADLIANPGLSSLSPDQRVMGGVVNVSPPT